MVQSTDRVSQQLGEYRLLRKLGGGGFGEVYLAEQVHDHSQVAVKVLHIRLTRSQDLKGFINEARAMRLRHPHIVPLLDFGMSKEDIPYLVMEYATGGTLRDRFPKGSRLAFTTVRSSVAQIASALQYAHDHHVIHRDVKPENMLVRADGTLLLSDFGITAMAHSTDSLSVQQGVGGTLPYMAPEQIHGKARPASDQYALAVVTYEWITGQRPFQGTSVEVAMQHVLKAPPPLAEQAPTLPRAVEAAVLKALSKEPKERFATVRDFAAALAEADRQARFPRAIRLQTAQVPSWRTPGTPIQPVDPLDHRPPSPLGSPVSPFARESDPHPNALSPEALSDQGRLTPTVVGAPAPANLPSLSGFQKESARRATSRWHGLSLGRVLLLVAATVVLLGSGSLLFGMVQTSSLRLQATVVARASETASTQAAATAETQAMMTPGARAYETTGANDGLMFGFDARHSHLNPYEQVLSPTTVAGLTKAWDVPTQLPIFASSPVVAGGRVYVGSKDGNLYALDTVSGSRKWIYHTAGAIDSSPAVVHGVVYVGSYDNTLYAIDAVSGSKRWAFNVGGGIGSSPSIAGGRVFIGCYNGNLYALDAVTGAKLWIFKTQAGVGSSPAVANGVVYVGSYDHYLYAIDAASGTRKWAFQAREKVLSSPAVVDGMVYVGSNDGTVYAIDAASGAQKWALQTSNQVSSSPAVAYGAVYVGSHDGNVYAIDVASGARKWVFQTGNAILSSPTVAGGVVYIGSEDHHLYAIDAASGALVWSFPTGSAIDSTPAVANGSVYVGSQDHLFYAFRLPPSP
ncbi:MAG TPA: PQQ-binding-like beta-propeller repeat protein [Ktedonosporobacter sp.]|nr:PQQ-binding-like beta-propeller repeat protein [Ktedonosporobacter sp.]